MPRNRFWTPQEEQFLEDSYDPNDLESFKIIAGCLNRSCSSVRAKAGRKGLRKAVPMHRRDDSGFAFSWCISMVLDSLAACYSITNQLEKYEVPYIVARYGHGLAVFRIGRKGQPKIKEPPYMDWIVVYRHPEHGTKNLDGCVRVH